MRTLTCQRSIPMKALLFVILMLFSGVCFAEEVPYPGNDSYYGLTSGGFPNIHTGNVAFSTQDIVVAGAVGEYGLSFERYASSRSSQMQNMFGLGHNWTHGWQFEMVDAGPDGDGRKVISVRHPFGKVNRFTETTEGKWWSTPNVRDRVISDGDTFTLLIRGGWQAYFVRNHTVKGDVFLFQEAIDSSGNSYKLSYAADNTLQVTAPAGRWLRIEHELLSPPNMAPNIAPFKVISRVVASDGQTVTYRYIFPTGADYPVLSGVTYPDGNTATYVYAEQREHTRLLLKQADDPRADSLLRGRMFSYRDEANAALGQIFEVKTAEGGEVLQALAASGDDPRGYMAVQENGARSYHYYLPGGHASETVDAHGFSSRTDYMPDPQGMHITTIDRLAQTTYSRENLAGDLVETEYADGSVRTWQYDAKGRLLVETDELGNKRVYTPDENGRVTRIQHPDGTAEEFTYNANGQILSHKDPGGGITRSEYDPRGLLTKVTDALGNATITTYDANDRVASVTDPLGNTTVYDRDPAGRIVKTTFPDGSFSRTGYDAFGNIVRMVDEAGAVRKMAYDSFGRQISSSDALGNETRHEYPPPGQNCTGCGGGDFFRPTKTITPSGRITSAAYDVTGNLRTVTTAAYTAAAATTRYSYDAEGRRTSVTNALGQTSSMFYDKRGRLVMTRSPGGHETTFTYDLVGNKLSRTDPQGNTTRWTYDEAGRVLTETDANGNVTKRAYYPSGQLAKLIDAKDNVYEHEYDALNRQTALIFPDGSRELTAYDAVGNRVRFTNRAGAVLTLQYDERNREIASEWSDGTQRRLTVYDEAGRITSIDNTVSRLTYSYDMSGRLLSETQDISPVATGGAFDPDPRTVQYTHTKDADRESLIYPDGSRVVYTYDEHGRVQDILGQGVYPAIASYEYDALGNATRMPRENRTETTREYNTENRLAQLVETSDRYHNPLSKLEYAYNEAGNRISTKVTTEGDVVRDSYQYDATHQVTGVDYGVSVLGEEPQEPTRSVLYTYDAVGNRQYVETGKRTTTYVANNLNQYSQVGEDKPTHDSNGNLSSLGEWGYRYDALNRLVRVSSRETTVHFLYDGKNRVVARNYDGRIVLNTYEGWNLIEEYGVTGQQQARYVHGPRIDEVLAAVNRHGLFYLHYDGLGSVTILTDEDGAVEETYSYTINGEVTMRGAEGEERDESAVGNRWMFTGREYLREIGLYDYRNRVYSAELGRFLQPDPIGFGAGDVNIYRYVLNNPVSFADPWGLWKCPTTGGIRGTDSYGSGAYGASRDGGRRTHAGVDYSGAAGSSVYAPMGGSMERVTGGVRITGTVGGETYSTKVLHITNTAKGGAIKEGAVIGKVENLAKKYPGITNHAHVEIYRIRSGITTRFNPTGLLNCE